MSAVGSLPVIEGSRMSAPPIAEIQTGTSLGGEILAVEHRERRVQIRDEIAGVLEPRREAQKPIRNPQRGPRLGRQPLMRRCRRMGDEAFRIPQIVCNDNQGKPICESKGRRLAASDLEGYERAAAGHLPPDDFGLGMIRAARVENLQNVAVAAQEFGDPFGALRLLANAQGKRLERFQENPGVEWRQAEAGLLIKRMNLVFYDPVAAENNAAETAAMPVDMLRLRVDDAIGPKRKRLLQNRGREDIIDDKAGAMFMRDRRDGRDIVDFKTGIGRRFEKQKLCFGPHRRAP